MASCGQTASNCSFLTAEQARTAAACPETIFAEIHAIQSQILTAIKNCELEITISDSTPITSNNSITSVTIDDGGTDYDVTSATSVVTHPTGVNADLVPEITNGTVTGFTINNGGTGYEPVVTTADATGVGNGDASLNVVVTSGVVTSIQVLAGGTGYNVNDVITIVHPTGINATAIVGTIGGSNNILSVTVTAGGTGYEPINATVAVVHPTGAGFTGTVLVNAGVVVGVSISTSGYGYQDLTPTINVTSTQGTGATFSVGVLGGAIDSVTVLNGGTGYDVGDTALVVPAAGDDGNGALVSLVVSTVIPILDTVLYHDVWTGLQDDRRVQAQLDYLVGYFACLGYNFNVQVNPSTGNTLQWYITW